MLRRNHPIIEMEKMMMSGSMGLSSLMAATRATVTAQENGRWSDAATWGGSAPGAGANVHIPAGYDVTYDVDSDTAMGWVRVDGILRWDPSIETLLVCDTILATRTSYLELGTPVAPVTGRARIRFVDGALMSGDMTQMSRGIVSLGRVMIRGQKKTPYVRLAGDVSRGSRELVVEDASQIADWQPGDTVSIPTTGDGTSVSTIASISGSTIRLESGTAQAHTGLPDASTPDGRFTFKRKPYVLNETRTVRFESQNPSGTRGHSMFAHNHPPTRLVPRTDQPWQHRRYPHDLGANADPRVDIRWAEFVGMGRTRATDSPKVGQPGNQVGRYAFHLHRVGHWTKDPVVVQGCVTVDSTIWAFTHHDSHAHFDLCIARQGVGAGFVCEDDTETGAWTRNFACDMNGGRGDVHAEQDFNGHGQGGEGYIPVRHMLMRGNKAAGCDVGIRLVLNEVSPQVKVWDKRQDPASPQWSPPGRWPDREAVRRTHTLSNPMAFVKHEDPNLGIWRDHEFYRCGDALSVFHRQRIYMNQPQFAQFREWNVWRSSRLLENSNYSWNYLFRDFVHQGEREFAVIRDKVSGMVFVNGTIEDVGTVFSGNAKARNAFGAFVDLNLVNTGQLTDSPEMPTTIHNSSGWTVRFTPPTGYEGAESEYVDTLSHNGVPLFEGAPRTIEDRTGVSANDRPKMSFMEAGAQGLHTLNSPLSQWRSGVRFPEQTGHSLSVIEMVEQNGCYRSGGKDVVALDFCMTDRFNGDIHPVRIEQDVGAAPESVRNENRLANPPPAPRVSDFHLEPGFPEDTPPASYLVRVDRATGALLVAIGGRLRLEADALFEDLREGERVQIFKTVGVRDQSNGSSSATVSFTVEGKGQAPRNTAAPAITRQRLPITAPLPRPRGSVNTAGSTRGAVSFELGEWTGFPEPVLEIRLLVNGSTYSRYNFHNQMYWAARSQQTETVQIAVRARNIHGTSEEVLSNVVSFVE